MTIDFNYALTKKLHHLFIDQQLKLTVAESCTGGGLCRQITEISGSTEVLDRGFVVYSNEAKMTTLGIAPEIIQDYGAVSAECALEMARGALSRSNADIAISITGITGPTGGSALKPVGTTYLALVTPDNEIVQHHLFSGGRKNIRLLCISHALLLIIEQVETIG